jgi:hypothetical protein
VFEDLLYDLLILDEGTDAHLPVAPRAGKGVYFVNLLDEFAEADKPWPSLPVLFE